jgi:hypothetical protein
MENEKGKFDVSEAVKALAEHYEDEIHQFGILADRNSSSLKLQTR